jgi:hypothetical protein
MLLWKLRTGVSSTTTCKKRGLLMGLELGANPLTGGRRGAV